MTRRKMNDGYYMPRLYDFLSRLRDNNYREWFKANKAEYDDLRAAWIEDIDRMIVLMGRWEPAIAMANSGKTASYRIYRDTRFSQDKTPFKTYFSASVSTRGRAPHYGGYYIEAVPGRLAEMPIPGCSEACGVRNLPFSRKSARLSSTI